MPSSEVLRQLQNKLKSIEGFKKHPWIRASIVDFLSDMKDQKDIDNFDVSNFRNGDLTITIQEEMRHVFITASTITALDDTEVFSQYKVQGRLDLKPKEILRNRFTKMDEDEITNSRTASSVRHAPSTKE